MKRIAFLLLVAGLLAGGCHKVPLGDPETSVVDPSLAGWWINEQPGESNSLIYVRAYDKRTYLVTAYGYKDSPIVGTAKFTTKAWITPVGGLNVMTFQIVDPEWEMGDEQNIDKRYCYYRIVKAGPGMIEATALNIDFLKETNTPDELKKKIEDNVNNPDLWKDSKLLAFKSAEGRKDEVKAILKAFEPPKAN